MAMVFIIDPYNMIRKEDNKKLVDLKKAISNTLNYPLYKMISYRNSPSSIIVLGDSRASKFTPELFKEIFAEDVFNLSYGGGTLPEIAETFFHIVESHKIAKVYICLNYNLYNKNNMRNRVPEVISITSSIGSYFGNKYTFKSTVLLMQSLVLGRKPAIETPPYSKEEFWDYQLATSATSFYKDYTYPDNYFKDLKSLSAYCKTKEIELVFIIPPTHVDLQRRIGDYGLYGEEARFKADISSLAKVYDFDYENSFTKKKGNFLDPYHFKDELSSQIMIDIHEMANKNY